MGGNRKPQTFRDCAHCGVRFGPLERLAMRFCSRECSYASRRGVPNPTHSQALKGRPNPKRRPRSMVGCFVCGKSFERHAYRSHSYRLFCSRECFAKKVPMVPCPICGAPFKAVDHRKFCSRGCAVTAHTGSGHPNWKGGTSLLQSDRNCPEVRKWRKAVFERDGNRCHDCGAKDDLHAHHLLSWVDNPSLRFELSNGRTLCARCHSAVHGRDLTRWKRRLLATGQTATLVRADGA